MNDIATSLNNMTDTRLLAKTDYDIEEKEMNEYYKIKDKVESLGGVAKTGNLTVPGLSTPPDYGDDHEDHINIALGYEMFAEDYPDYPDIGYYGIPLSGWMAELAEVILGMN